MLRELTVIPTDTLLDMLFVILSTEAMLTATDIAEIVDIQCELQRRGEVSSGAGLTVN